MSRDLRDLPYIINDHARDQFVDRWNLIEAEAKKEWLDQTEASVLAVGVENAAISPWAIKEIPRLEDQLAASFPIGAQQGEGFLRSLPCGLVAAGYSRSNTRVVSTVLTFAQAIANMQSKGVMFHAPVRNPTVVVHDPKVAKKKRKTENPKPSKTQRFGEFSKPAKLPDAVRGKLNVFRDSQPATPNQIAEILRLHEQYDIPVDRARLKSLTIGSYQAWAGELGRYQGRKPAGSSNVELLKEMVVRHVIRSVPRSDRILELAAAGLDADAYEPMYVAAKLTYDTFRQIFRENFTRMFPENERQYVTEASWKFWDFIQDGLEELPDLNARSKKT